MEGGKDGRKEQRMSQGGWGGALPLALTTLGEDMLGGVAGVGGGSNWRVSVCHEFSPSPTTLNAQGLHGNGNATMATHVV